MYCAVTQLMRAVIFIGSGKISYGKLSQALDYGALTVQIEGDFDDAMARVKEVATLRALGFRRSSILGSFLVEAIILCAVGGLFGCLRRLLGECGEYGSEIVRSESQLDGLTRECFCFSIQQRLGSHGRLVARSLGPAFGVA